MFERQLEKASERNSMSLLILGPFFGMVYVMLLPLIGVMTFLLALPEYAFAKKVSTSETSGMCLTCHTSKGITKVFKNNEKLSVLVNASEIKSSVHGKLTCNDCHPKISMSSHPGRVFDSKAAFAIETAKACKICHTEDKLKAKPNHAFVSNKTNAPPCTECHGAHNVKRVAEMKPTIGGNQYCLTCHQKTITKTFDNGEKISLTIKQEQLSASVHNKHACSDCHTDFTKTSHPAKRFSNSREHSITMSEACRKCHADKYVAVKDSIHYKMISEGHLNAPVCTDCHGFHNVSPKVAYETFSGVPCRKCHENVYKIYTKSVHGIAKANGQHHAPLCSSCHFAHEVKVTALTEKIKSACLGCHKEAEAAHEKWLPNAGLHLSVVACAACHSPNSGKGIYLKLYDEATGKPFTEEQILKLLGTSYEGLAEKLGAHGEGMSSEDIWAIIRELNAKGANARLTFMGRMDVSNGLEAHQLSYKKDAVKDCENCHTNTSKYFKNVSVAIVKADGRLTRFNAKPDVLGSVISLAPLKNFYVLGSTRLKLLDWVGIAMILGGASVPVLHLTIRILTSPVREARRLNRLRKEGKK